MVFLNEMGNTRERCIWWENNQCKIWGIILLRFILGTSGNRWLSKEIVQLRSKVKEIVQLEKKITSKPPKKCIKREGTGCGVEGGS